MSDYGLDFCGTNYGDGDSFSVISDIETYCQKVTKGVDTTWIGRDMSKEKRRRDTDKGRQGTSLKSVYLAYGNEASLEFMYGSLTLVVSVGPHGKRERFEMEKEKTRQKEEEIPLMDTSEV